MDIGDAAYWNLFYRGRKPWRTRMLDGGVYVWTYKHCPTSPKGFGTYEWVMTGVSDYSLEVERFLRKRKFWASDRRVSRYWERV